MLITCIGDRGNLLRTEVMVYSCNMLKSKIELRLEYWPVAQYTLSFTPQECLEEFCDLVGWEFLECRGGDHVGPVYTFHSRVPTGRLVIDTIYDWNHYYRERIEAGTV